MAVFAPVLNGLVTFLPLLGPGLAWVLDRFDVVSYKRRLSWKNVERGILRLETAVRQSGFDADLVIGSGRSGSLVGSWLAGELGNKPFATMDIAYRTAGKMRETEVDAPGFAVRGKKIILTSSEHKTGQTSMRELALLIEEGAAEVRCATLVQYTFSLHEADYYSFQLEREVDFPWRLTTSFTKRS